MKTSHALLAIAAAAAAGVAVGATIGILTAPRKGSETRQQIRDYIKNRFPDIKDNALDSIVKQISSEIKS